MKNYHFKIYHTLRALLLCSTLLFANFSFAGNLKELTAKANQGDAPAQNDLGVMYHDGKGVPQDYKQAVNWYAKAANLNYAPAQFNLGNMYHDGDGVPQDYIQALSWYTKAANQNDADAQYNLGIMYANGRGVPQDDKQAVNWYAKAANLNYAPAQLNLGVMYANGQGVPQDYKQAYVWSSLAAANGIKDAVNNRMFTEGKLTPQDLAEAQKEAKSIFDKIEANKK